MLEGARIVVVVPAFREAARIGAVLASMPAMVDHIVVVDDASDDGTAARARKIGDPRVEVLRHGANRGVGAAIVTGYKRAMTIGAGARDAFVVMAGDGQMAPADLPSLVLPIARGHAGYVKGDRFRSPDAGAMPWQRRLGGEVFSRLTSLAIGVPIEDSQCGYTALARWACAELDLDALWPRYGYPNDLLGQLARRGVPIREVVVQPIYAGEASGLRPWHLARIAHLIARAWVRRLRAR